MHSKIQWREEDTFAVLLQPVMLYRSPMHPHEDGPGWSAELYQRGERERCLDVAEGPSPVEALNRLFSCLAPEFQVNLATLNVTTCHT